MDSLTQATLGAAIGEAILGKKSVAKQLFLVLLVALSLIWTYCSRRFLRSFKR